MEFRLADIGEGTTEAEILRWLVHEGQEVAEYDPLVEVQTDKVTAELPSPRQGVVRRILVAEGAVVPVGTALCVIEAPGEEGAQAETPTSAAPPAKGTREAPRPAAAVAARAGRVLASPATRRRALELGVDIEAVPGTGPGGRVTMEDVEAFHKARGQRTAAPAVEAVTAAPPPKPAPMAEETTPAVERRPLRGLRRVIAKNMSESHAAIPQALHLDDCDVTELVALRRSWNAELAESSEHLTFLPFILKAVAVALKAHPGLNAHFDAAAQEVVLHREVHIGVATDTPDGLVVPVLKHVERRSLRDIARELRRLGDAARSRTLTQQDVEGATFTVTNHGSLGGLYGSPVIPLPQVAILGLGRIRDEAVVRGGEIQVRSILHYSIAFDHRVLDGGDVARFGNDLVRYLEHPELLTLELA
jgi:pyruvate/2-oxoglutarate dehydrogenase complex dihydrolipoamide acyltransferase (E2) component